MPPDLSLGRASEEASTALAVRVPGVALELPELVGQAGEDAAYRTLEFFTSCIPNPNTRDVYGQAVREFGNCEREGGRLDDVARTEIDRTCEMGRTEPVTVRRA